MIRKNRERLLRGVLKSFKDLPENHQNNFSLIKREVQKYFDGEVYVFGSFYWGYWDDESDYDVFIKYRDSKNPKTEFFDVFNEIKNNLYDIYGLTVDVMMIREEIGVLIP